MPRFFLTCFTATSVLFTISSDGVSAQPPGAAEATPVVVSSVDQREVAEGRTFVGTVHASRISTVGTAVDGRVEEMRVNDGDWVERLDPLALLRTKTIHLELRAARAELQLRKQELAELEAGSRPEEIDRAQAALDRAQALFDYAESRLTRTQLLPESASSLEELEQDRSSRDAAKNSLDEAEADLELVKQGPRMERILQAQARLRMQALQVLRLKDQFEKYTIRAPFDGYIVTKHAEVGQWLSRADPVVEIVAVDPIEVWVSIPEAYIEDLKPGMEATVRLDALPNFTGIPVAEISRIVPQADVRSRSFPVRIQLENPRQELQNPGRKLEDPPEEHGHVIKPGMLAHVTLAVGRTQRALLVRKDALVLGGRSPVVYVVRVDPETGSSIAMPVPVQLGVAEDDRIQVIGELQAGEKVVVEGNERLQPGMKVRPIERPSN